MESFIRKVCIEDAESINHLSIQLGYKLSFQETTIQIKEVIHREDHCVFVIILEGRLIGWIHGFEAIRIESKPFIEIAGMVVDENYRGKGAGRKLVDAMKEWSSSKGINKLRVRCNNKRLETHKFYSKIGFREVKEQKIFEVEISKDIPLQDGDSIVV